MKSSRLKLVPEPTLARVRAFVAAIAVLTVQVRSSAFASAAQAQTSPRLSRRLPRRPDASTSWADEFGGRIGVFGGEVGGTIGKITSRIKRKYDILPPHELCDFSEWTPEKVKKRQFRLAKLAAEARSFNIK